MRPNSTDPDQLALDFGDDDSGAKVAAQASMVRARAVIDLADALDAEVEQRNGTSLLYGVELPLLRTLARMEQTGVAVDVDHLEALEAEFGATVNRAASEAYEVLGKQINLGSPKQLQVVLFDELGMPKTRRTRTGYTTDADALQQLYVKTEHPFLAHLLVHRDAIRLKQTVEGLLKSVADDGRIHTTYVQTIAATGRLSSTDPNLQNIPIRTEEGRRIRAGVRGGRGVRRPDVSGLLADRDAHHGARQRGREPDRGVQVGHGLPHRHRVPGFRRRADSGHAGRAGQDQGDELRPGVRAERVRAEPAAEHRGVRGEGADG